MTRLTKDQIALKDATLALVKTTFKPTAAATDSSEPYLWDNIAKLREGGVMGMTIPTYYGGHRLSYTDTVLVIEEMALCCSTVGLIDVKANIRAIGVVMKYGSVRQKCLAADYVLAGDKPAICITEPGASRAANEITTTAV